ncbi:MAG: potassium channel family protein [Rhodothermia bacterium]|nr:potassium channel family protein [Rhodothermia bacterium]
MIDWLVRAESTRREIFLASAFLAALLVTGTIGYSVVEGWGWLDGLDMTFITLTTIGFAKYARCRMSGEIQTGRYTNRSRQP